MVAADKAEHGLPLGGPTLGTLDMPQLVRPGIARVSPYVTVYRFDEPAPPASFTHTGLSTCIVAQGSARARVGDESHVCPAGSYIVKAWTNGFETEILEATSESPFMAMLIEFTLPEVETAVNDLTKAIPEASFQRVWSPTAYVTQPSQRSTDLFQRYIAAMTSTSVVDRKLLLPLRRRELLYRLLVPLIESAFETSVPPSVPRHGSSFLEPAIQLLTADLARPLSIAELASVANMSPSRFAHVFKERTGLSPHQFHKRLRLEHAKHLLEETGASVSITAAEAGYVNVSHFISDFRRRFGQTPGSFTRQRFGGP